ncbi:GNAT family N-acetyltransferase [Paenisporosarcina sp.]|uniref:GNAT family N-acetyltransferase n=1 Tax=Paenisporosarcina sp. TaxID=1932001 RepID=UPI003C772541
MNQVRLERATIKDAESLFDMQVKAFTPLMEKYKDYAINPANEKIERVITRITNPNGVFYKILLDTKFVGAICVFWKEDVQFWISPMFIFPEYQGQGIAKKAILLTEERFPHAVSWELATILEEKRNCHLYEKMGYVQTGEKRRINELTTLVFYKKVLGLNIN